VCSITQVGAIAKFLSTASVKLLGCWGVKFTLPSATLQTEC
jgi:hypothetical protein